MGQPLTTTTGYEASPKVYHVNRGEQLAVRIQCLASSAVDWTNATCTGAIRTDTGALVFTFATETATLDSDGNATFLMAAESDDTADFGAGRYYANWAVTAGTNGPFHTKTHPVQVHNAPVQP